MVHAIRSQGWMPCRAWRRKCLWNTSSWKCERVLNVPKGDISDVKDPEKSGGKFVMAIAWSADRTRITCSTMDGSKAIFDVRSGKLLHELEGPKGGMCLPNSPPRRRRGVQEEHTDRIELVPSSLGPPRTGPSLLPSFLQLSIANAVVP